MEKPVHSQNRNRANIVFEINFVCMAFDWVKHESAASFLHFTNVHI